MWYRIEEVAKRNPNYALIYNSYDSSTNNSCDEMGYGDQDPDVDMSYEKVEAESREVLFFFSFSKQKPIPGINFYKKFSVL